MARLTEDIARLDAIAEWLSRLNLEPGDEAGLTRQLEGVETVHRVIDALLEVYASD